MKVGFIGAGRLGCALAIGLSKKGYSIEGVYSRRQESIDFLNKKLGRHFENSLRQTVESSEVIFITVPDLIIKNIADDISRVVSQEYIHGKVFFHCSGALTSDVLCQLRNGGAYTASFHPVQTFADTEHGWTGLENIYFGFEGCGRSREKAEAIAKTLKSRIITIEKENKLLYHAAACILSNYTVTLAYTAGKLFENAGINAADGIRAFSPLIEKTVGNIKKLGAFNALTGPISRGDYETVQKHIIDINKKVPGIAEIYKVVGRMTVEAALEKGSIDEMTAELLKETLK